MTNKGNVILYLLAGITSITLYFIGNEILSFATITLFALFYIRKPIILTSMYLVFLPLVADASAMFLISSIIIIFVSHAIDMIKKNNHVTHKSMIHLILIMISAIISFIIGYQTNFNTLIVYIMLLSLYFFMSSRKLFKKEFDELNTALLIGFGTIVVIVVIQLFIADAIFVYSRLTFDGNKKEFADSVLVVLFLLSIKFFTKKKISLFLIICMISLVILLFLSQSRSAIIAYITVFILMALMYTKKKRFMGVILLLSIPVFYIIASNNLIDFDALFANTEGFNGRDEIWQFYHNFMVNRSGITGILFGVGPGISNRIINESVLINTSYVHSLFIDLLISYGYMGFILAIIIPLGILFKGIKTGNRYAVLMIIMIFLMYLTHGLSGDIHYYLFLFMGNSSLYLNLANGENSKQLQKLAYDNIDDFHPKLVGELYEKS